MAKVFFTSANLYASIASNFYQDFLQIEEAYQLADAKLKSDPENTGIYHGVLGIFRVKEERAIEAVIFQALAIEAYINLFGVTEIGEERFYGDKIERIHPSSKKLRRICSEISKTYPEEHLLELDKLFKKRDDLVHQKPRNYIIEETPYDYDHPGENYRDLLMIENEQFFVFDNLDREMKLYEELQNNIKTLRGSEEELIEETQRRMVEENYREIGQRIAKTFNLGNSIN